MKKKLAIDGGTPARKTPFPPRIIFDNREKQAALRVINKTMTGPEALDLFGQGEEIEAYKKEFASFFGVKYATPTSSGTAAIHTALASLRLEPGAEVITTPITDPGTVAPILMQNCIPVFADVDYDTMNINAGTIKKKITRKTKVIIAVHLAGQPCDMDPIMELAKKYRIMVIEDCAQAHGSKYKGKYAGSIGHIGTFSLMGSKQTTSGGQGGMVITNNEEIYWNAKRFADRGKPFNSKNPTNLFLGMNYRMTELQAAIGRVQLKKLKKQAEVMQETFKKIKNEIEMLKVIRPWKIIDSVVVNPWFCLLFYNSNTGMDKDTFVKTINAEGIPLRKHYTSVIYNQTWIKEKNTYGNSHYPWTAPTGRWIDYNNSCPNAERALADCMTLHIHEGWKNKEINDTIKAFKKVEKCYEKA
ncbi:MAG: hypothetical protein A3J83_06405 [Elusimicrobia bacterium RIFOXYA2_FULL_40_6]|nr:MAG: hypothetical protein A3J83_06405 [Elusimicrobia bacterium RIFOXYA2_FULL_40_6]